LVGLRGFLHPVEVLEVTLGVLDRRRRGGRARLLVIGDNHRRVQRRDLGSGKASKGYPVRRSCCFPTVNHCAGVLFRTRSRIAYSWLSLRRWFKASFRLATMVSVVSLECCFFGLCFLSMLVTQLSRRRSLRRHAPRCSHPTMVHGSDGKTSRGHGIRPDPGSLHTEMMPRRTRQHSRQSDRSPQGTDASHIHSEDIAGIVS